MDRMFRIKSKHLYCSFYLAIKDSKTDHPQPLLIKEGSFKSPSYFRRG